MKPLSIGKLTFANNLIQGPLAGYSCSAYRKLFYQFQSPAYCVTEMISAQDLIKNKHIKKRFIHRDPIEKYLCYQFGGYEPDTMLRAAKLAMDWGADLIDINCGCPKPKIRKKRMGSYLLDHPEQIAKIIETLKKTISLPITVKIRLVKSSSNQNDLDAIKKIVDAGADALIVHGRHWTEDYNVTCHLDDIAEIVKAIKIPVIGNGDIFNLSSLTKMFDIAGCAGVMISRGGTGNPWIYEQLVAEAAGKKFSLPALEKIKALFLEHLEGLLFLENETIALLQSRKLLKYYFGENLKENDFNRYCSVKNQKEAYQFLEQIK